MQSYDGKHGAKAPAESGERAWAAGGPTRGHVRAEPLLRPTCRTRGAADQVAISSSTSPSDITIRPPIRM